MNCQVDELSSWWIVKLMNCQVDELSSKCIVKLMNCQVDEMASLWNCEVKYDILTKRHSDKTWSWKTTMWQTYVLTKWQFDETASWQKTKLVKYEVDEMTS
jgi:hypothetical protein